ncbi:MAG: hypothetical protein OEU92_13945 [Alphaproteobacteria bacterium]|nr:hypothetical protein [Alphaproteobacteria bacterium]
MRLIAMSLAISLGTTTMAAAVGTWLIREELATQPLIAIIDYGLIGNAVSLGVPPETIQPYFAEIKRRAQAYQAAGYIVINAASVDAAPDEMFVPPLDDVPEAWLSPPVTPSKAKVPDLGTDSEGESQ